MHIVLLILKIIGAILGGLLGLLIFLLLLILFVPVRYRVEFKAKETVRVDSCISWLLHIVHVRILYGEKKTKYCLRIFGIPVKQNKEEEAETIKEPKSKKKQKSSKEKKSKTSKNAKVKGKKTKKSSNEQMVHESVDARTNKASKVETKKSEVKQTKTKVLEEASVRKEENEKSKVTEEKKGFHLFCKLKEIWNKFIELLQSIPQKISKFRESIKKLIERKDKILAFIKEEGTKNTFRKTKKVLFGWIGYVSPRKLKGYVKFGTGDPCQTGQLLGIVSIIYTKYKLKFSVYPDFENKIFEADLMARGRIRTIRFLRDGGKWYFDKEVKKLFADIKRLKEEL